MLRILFVILAFATTGVAPALAVTFNHTEHNTYIEGVGCDICHVEDAFSIVPEKEICLACHEQEFVDEVDYPMLSTHGPVWAFSHRPAAKGNSIDCAACHEQSFCLECHKAGFADEQGAFGNNMMNVHRGDFQVSHPIAARTDPQLCSSCHEAKFCSECHATFNRNDLGFDSHRRGWSDISVSGTRHGLFTEDQCQSCHAGSVFTSHDWQRNHAREARKNLATCEACHPDGDVCLRCHSDKSGLRINPHPKDWGDISSRLDKASGGRTCRKCHFR
ncbi:MAG TPA: cytochrome C [Geopsychrobacteraceae bacterium]|jgi:hypothetical protein